MFDYDNQKYLYVYENGKLIEVNKKKLKVLEKIQISTYNNKLYPCQGINNFGKSEIINIKIILFERYIIGKQMFEGCSSLKRIELSDSLSEIGEQAFRDCRSLDIITIPDSVKSIGNTAFDNVHKLFIIQCSFGSYAESFARKHKIKYQLV